ncbi:MAG: MFS transporter, partial [Kordiimonadaceae bacterium]|nr:MFS transporter [Kordiimonadaceae bacterium]
WGAFFITFMMWFNHAPLLAAIRESLSLTEQEVKTLMVLNVALTIPARIVIGMLVDKYGPRHIFSMLLAISGLLCFGFALSSQFETLALMRFLLGFSGAGFVIGIRLIGEWFPARQLGVAEGIYGGWGNFGSAAAAMTLPTLALLYGGEDGWRYAVGTTGIIAILYSGIFFLNARNTPEGATYFKPKKAGGLEVSNKSDLILCILMQAPLFIALGLLVWKLGSNNLALFSQPTEVIFYIGLAALFVYNARNIFAVNKPVLEQPVAEIHQYKFKQVAVLSLAYMTSFGSELAVVSMLPLYFMDTFNLSAATAGLFAAGFAFMNIMARPAGGWLSDTYGRKRVMVFLFIGLTAGYLGLSQVSSDWLIGAAVIMCMACSFFVQSAEGAVFAIVPLVKRRLTGQIAGMVGAFGNVGGVTFLIVYSFVDAQTFFLTISATSVLTMVFIIIFFEEPKGHTAEVLPDGTVQLIEVS